MNAILSYGLDALTRPLDVFDDVEKTEIKEYIKPVQFIPFTQMRARRDDLFSSISEQEMAHEIVSGVRNDFIKSFEIVRLKRIDK